MLFLGRLGLLQSILVPIPCRICDSVLGGMIRELASVLAGQLIVDSVLAHVHHVGVRLCGVWAEVYSAGTSAFLLNRLVCFYGASAELIFDRFSMQCLCWTRSGFFVLDRSSFGTLLRHSFFILFVRIFVGDSLLLRFFDCCRFGLGARRRILDLSCRC